MTDTPRYSAMTEAVVAKAYSPEMQRLIPTGPGRSVSFRACEATIFNELDMPVLLATPGITVEVRPEYADHFPRWLSEINPPYPRCTVLGIAEPVGLTAEQEPVDMEEVPVNVALKKVIEVKAVVERRGRATKTKTTASRSYSPKGRTLNLSPEQRAARSKRAKRNFQKQPVGA